ncbi:NAD(P)-dependent oxidoreductase [Streptomyces sp. JNUCC 63]
MSGSKLVPEDVLSYIRFRGYETRHTPQDHFTSAELDKLLDGARGYLIGGYESASAKNFEQATALEAVAFVGTDYKAYVEGWSRAQELGVALISSADANAVSVAEFTVSLILAMARPLLSGITRVGSEGAGQETPGLELDGKCLGILGLGRIGGRVARVAKLGLARQL